MRIGTAVQHQDDFSAAGRGLHFSENDKNKVYVNIIDNFYVILQDRIR